MRARDVVVMRCGDRRIRAARSLSRGSAETMAEAASLHATSRGRAGVADQHVSRTGRAGDREARRADAAALESDVRLVQASRTAGSKSRWSAAPRGASINDLSRKLEQWTGRRWTRHRLQRSGRADVAIAGRGREESSAIREAEADPRVREVLARFPGAKVIEVRRIELGAAGRRQRERHPRQSGRRQRRLIA